MSLKVTSQSGFSITSLVIGIALSLISTAAAYNFYLKNQRLTAAIAGESEAMLHLAVLLKQTFRRFPPKGVDESTKTDADALCLQLASGNVRFQNLPKEKLPATITDKNWRPDKAVMLSGMKESSSGGKSRSGYKIERLSIIQKSTIIGQGPPRVLADLVVVVNLKGNVGSRSTENDDGLDAETKGNKKLRTLVVPMLLELDSSLKPANCMDKPTPEDMCKENGRAPNGSPTSPNCGGTP